MTEQNHKNLSSYLWPIGVSLAVLGGLNFLWVRLALYRFVPHALAVYLIGGSGLALFFLWRGLHDGRVTKQSLGLSLSGWTAWKRILGVALVALVSLGGYARVSDQVAARPAQTSASAPDASAPAAKPTWGDFCFWWVLGLAASFAELLVFVAVGFCFLQQGLLQRGFHWVLATTIAAAFSAVTFGLYHFTHHPMWWSAVVYPLMPVMLFNVICFIVTRNFYLTLGVHSAMAAMGMTRLQNVSPAMDINRLQQPAYFLPTFMAFLIPFMVLHWLEARGPDAAPPK